METVNTTIGFFHIKNEKSFKNYIGNKILDTSDILNMEIIGILERVPKTILVS